jgi:hypothetical protein
MEGKKIFFDDIEELFSNLSGLVVKGNLYNGL